MIQDLIKLITGRCRDGNAIDRLNNYYTVILLAVFAVISTTYEIVGDPIVCWSPAEFHDNWVKYTNSLCWVQNTYFLPFEDDIPKEKQTKSEIVYYQWVPFIFLGLAVLFYVPSLLWTLFNKAGIDLENLLQSAKTLETIKSKDTVLKFITNQINQLLGRAVKMNVGATDDFPVHNCQWRFGTYLVVMYLFTKLLYIGNGSFQLFFIVGSLLKTDFTLYAIKSIITRASDDEFLNQTIFPKVTMCEVTIRALGVDNTRKYTVQCLLPINMYTDKIFVFLWFWIAIVTIVTFVDFLDWLYKSSSQSSYKFIENSLLLSDRVDTTNVDNRMRCLKFVRNYLCMNGVFVLRLIALHTNHITASEIIASLWDNWCENYDVKCDVSNKNTDICTYTRHARAMCLEAPPVSDIQLPYSSLCNVGGAHGQTPSSPLSARTSYSVDEYRGRLT